MYVETTATRKIFDLDKRIRAVAGGTSASKTISILIYLIDYAQSSSDKVLISVVSQTYNHLAGGAMLDFQNIMQAHSYWDDRRWVKSPIPQYTFENGSVIEFRSIDKIGKAKGMRRSILFLNEANHISFDIAEQLILRTTDFIFLDWNPTFEFWFYTEFLNKRNDVDFITLTYKDNEALGQSIIDEIEKLKAQPNKWKVYGLGQLGEVEGRVYTGWQIIDSIPHEARLERYGLDFGYSVDPTAIVAIYYHNGGYIVDEITYQKELRNAQIADILKSLKPALVIADSAEPKSIDELKLLGVNILPAQKGQGSVEQGIQYVQNLRISVTKHSYNLLKEYGNLLHEQDPETNKFIPGKYKGARHALDALRYGSEGLRSGQTVSQTLLKTLSKGQFKRMSFGR